VERDAYAFLLIAIVATIVLIGFGNAGGPLAIGVQGGTLVFALWTSGARPRPRLIAAVLAVAALIIAVVNTGHVSRWLEVVDSAFGVLLAVGAMGAILRRAKERLMIDRDTVLAVMAVYLLIGMAYTYLFGLIGSASSTPFFSGDHGTVDPADFIYYSFVTLSTVGYGDFTAATRAGRLVSVSEAIIGQLYLVSVVGLVVGNFGRQREDGQREDGNDNG
jgi:hypothetical protein